MKVKSHTHKKQICIVKNSQCNQPTNVAEFPRPTFHGRENLDMLHYHYLDMLHYHCECNLSPFRFLLKGPTEPVHLLQLYQDQVISATTGNRIGHHTYVSKDSVYTSYRLRGDSLRGIVTAMEIMPLNRMMLLGADGGNIRLLC